MRAQTAGQNARLLILLLDFLVFLALFSTNEIAAWVFLAAIVVAVFGLVIKVHLPDRLMVAVLFISIMGAALAAARFRVSPVAAAAHAAPLFHSFLWLASNAERFRSWRIGMGFIGLVLAAALTPEFHIFALIIIFIVTCSLAIACVFLDNSLREKAPSLVKHPLPRGFMRYTIGLSLTVFLTSLVIFPLLPRLRLGTGLGFGKADIGYSEEVNTSLWAQFREDGEQRIVLRIFLPEYLRALEALPFALLRGKVLEHFNGKEWLPATKQSVESISKIPQDPSQRFEVISEPMNSSVLVLPYGAKDVQPLSNFTSFRRFTTGEWGKGSLNNKRAQYGFFWRGTYQSIDEQDQVREIHQRLVDFAAKPKIEELSRRIFKAHTSDAEKLQAVADYLRGFSATLRMEPVAGEDPLNYFLTTSHKGHCELFATAAALLLRQAGVPTRLVVGFRLSRPPSGGVLQVSNAEAHAWVEAFIKGRGWQSFDPTPGVALPRPFFEGMRNVYDTFSAYWYRYVLSVDAESQMDWSKNVAQGLRRDTWNFPQVRNWISSRWLQTGTLVIVVISLITVICWLIWLVLQFYWFGWRREGARENREKLLAKERRRFEKMQKRHLLSPELIQEWTTLYQQHRYGAAFDVARARRALRQLLTSSQVSTH